MKLLLKLSLAAATLLATQAMAQAVYLPDTQPEAWKKECQSCHTGFPPQMMRKADWKSLMATLDKHFGTDASLSAADKEAISAFLQEHAMLDNNDQRSATEMRVTSTKFFRREHKQFIPDLFKHPEVKRASNCETCHKEPGEFTHTVTLPADMNVKIRGNR